MKLSEAIRLGAMLRPQAYGDLFEDGKTCAFGAALETIGWNPERDTKRPWIDQRWVNAFPIQDGTHNHPVTGRKCRISTIIVSLNNDARWTREQIADWVETIEREQEAKQFEKELVGAA